MQEKEILERLTKIIVEQLGVEEGLVKPEATFVEDLSADSLDIVELVMGIEDEFELEIPEISEGTVLIYSVAREAGNRTKIAVYSEDSNVDAVGACIGEKGFRINRITTELGGEKIDIVPYDKDAAKFIENALSPAKDLHVFVTDEKKQEALVVVNQENLSLAIGRKGVNVRLASRLTHYKIDVKTYEQAREMGINVVE